MNFGALKVRQRDPKWIILGAKRRLKTHQEIVRKSVSSKLQFGCQIHTKMMPACLQNIITNDANKLQRNMSRFF